MRASAYRTALVTGASAGIGRSFCRELAAAGVDVVAVARRHDRLHELAAELGPRYGIKVTPIAADLSQAHAPDDIAAALAAGGIAVDLLINNAGRGIPGRFLSSAWEVHAAYINLMMGAVARLTYLLLPGMHERGQGAIVNIASVAGLVPAAAGHTLYGASKAWMIRFSEALAAEHAADGIRVCVICPGFTHSEFHDVTGTRAQVAGMPAWLWMTADEVARLSLAALARGDTLFIPGAINRMIVRAAHWLPRRLANHLIRRQARHFRDAR